MTPQQWTYDVTMLVKKWGDQTARSEVAELMNKWASAGWELVSASATPMSEMRGGVGAFPIETHQYIHYAMYWRKAIAPKAS
jgi:hypothetical protein